MTMSASIDITSTAEELLPGKPITVMLAVHNSGASAVNVTDIHPDVTPIDGGWAVSPALYPTSDVEVPAAGSLYFFYRVVFYNPQDKANAPDTYTIGATIETDNGSVFSPPTETIVLSKESDAPPAVAGQFDFTSPLNSPNLMLW